MDVLILFWSIKARAVPPAALSRRRDFRASPVVLMLCVAEPGSAMAREPAAWLRLHKM
jgi:hypothetical protein